MKRRESNHTTNNKNNNPSNSSNNEGHYSFLTKKRTNSYYGLFLLLFLLLFLGLSTFVKIHDATIPYIRTATTVIAITPPTTTTTKSSSATLSSNATILDESLTRQTKWIAATNKTISMIHPTINGSTKEHDHRDHHHHHISTTTTTTKTTTTTTNNTQPSTSSSTKTPATTTTTTTTNMVSIVVPLNGEMGNHLSRLAHGLGLQFWMQQTLGIHNAPLVLRNSGYGRDGGPRDVQRCFPRWRHVDFRQGNSDEYELRVVQQEQLLRAMQQEQQQQQHGGRSDHQEDNHNSQPAAPSLVLKNVTPNAINQTLTTLQDMIRWTTTHPSYLWNISTNASSSSSFHNASFHNISLPFVTVEADFVVVDVLADLYYEEFRNVLAFDTEACCKLKPDPDESVFHFRNFQKEMPLAAILLGFDELDANRTAHELFGHLQPADKVAIVTRFDTHSTVQEYVHALQQRGIHVRVVTGQSGVEDFCFLLLAQKELVGMAESTFVLWAGYLGQAQKVRLYSVNSARRRTSWLFSHRVFVHYNWTNPTLRNRIFFELYQAHDEDDDKQEEKTKSGEDSSPPPTSPEKDQKDERNNATAPTAASPDNAVTTIIVPLNGEMGNHLSGIAHGFGLHWWAEREYGMKTELVLRNSGSGRDGGPRDTQRCFPHFAKMDFRRGNTPEYDQRVLQQQAWLPNGTDHQGNVVVDQNFYEQLIIKNYIPEVIEQTLTTLRHIQTWTNRSYVDQLFSNATSSSSSANISLPFLTVLGDFVLVDAVADKYYEDFRNVFAFDFEACCKLKPDPDESVFHFRNFKKEMGDHAAHHGFDELDPNRTAAELFGHLQAGDKLAITSRFGTDPSVQPYVDALTRRGIQVRVITEQSGVQDFCFLLHAKKELVGMAESTYTLWAGFLGNATKVRLYSMDSPGRRTSWLFSHRVFVHYNWTNPSLQKKVFFELYKHPSIS